ncbi:hypothetical protein Q5P01_024191 [Channa striata]|uniref:Uncharacterized protein n=1 Tax=Channa striata TaxID=64152 RepID=A0AA88J3W0_CHASR|nr:hypothetical protein Q5P01_024191 [Channa striata]
MLGVLISRTRSQGLTEQTHSWSCWGTFQVKREQKALVLAGSRTRRWTEPLDGDTDRRTDRGRGKSRKTCGSERRGANQQFGIEK